MKKDGKHRGASDERCGSFHNRLYLPGRRRSDSKLLLWSATAE